MNDLQPHQEKIAKKKYFRPGENTWVDLVERVYQAVMKPDIDQFNTLQQDSFEKILKGNELRAIKQILLNREFLFNTPTWINAGLEGKRTLSACFVGELHDTMLGPGGILDCSRWFGAVQKYGGGTGIDLSEIRPKGSIVQSTHGSACGPVMVLKYLATTSQMITQGGARDGANMAVMSVYHPDLIEFIECKSKESKYLLELPRELAQQKIDNKEWTLQEAEEYIEYCRRAGVFQLFNVSVAVDRAFMQAVEAYETHQPDGAIVGLSELDPTAPWNEGLPCKKTILQVWNLIIDQAWRSGDPGLLFIDRAQEFAKLHSPYIPHSTNPCGEQWLPEHGSCNLGSIDLAKFVIYGSGYEPTIDWNGLGACIKHSVKLLDNVVSVNQHAVPQIEKVNLEERRIGLGIMGWADMLFKMRIPYDSEQALQLLENVAKVFKTISHNASVELAEKSGEFPLYSQVKDIVAQPDEYAIFDAPIMPDKPRRNATVTTVAPTGTISLMAGCSSGIEPHFLLKYEHAGLREQGGLGLIWASDTLKEAFEINFGAGAGRWADPDQFEKIIREDRGWKPANEIGIEWHIKHQALWQKYIDNSISKTLNIPNSATRADIRKTYLLSWKSGCKGSTVYRDGCKPFQVLNAPKAQDKTIVDQKPAQSVPGAIQIKDDWLDNKSNTQVIAGIPLKRKRNELVPGVTVKIKTSDGSLYVTINRGIRDEPFEVFATVGKAGGKAHAYTEAIGRLISLALQYNIPCEDVIKELRGISSGDPVGFGEARVLSVPDGIGQALQKFLDYENFGEPESVMLERDMLQITSDLIPSQRLVDACPECGADLFKEEGCSGGKCIVCGYSKC